MTERNINMMMDTGLWQKARIAALSRGETLRELVARAIKRELAAITKAKRGAK